MLLREELWCTHMSYKVREDCLDWVHRRRFHHHLHGFPLPDLHDSGEDGRVVVAPLQGSHGHHLLPGINEYEIVWGTQKHHRGYIVVVCSEHSHSFIDSIDNHSTSVHSELRILNLSGQVPSGAFRCFTYTHNYELRHSFHVYTYS